MRLLHPIVAAVSALLLASPALGATLDPETVREAISSAARRNLPDTVVDIEVRSLKVTGDLDVPAGGIEVRVLGRGEWLGRVRLDLEVYANDAAIGSISATAELIGYVDMPVLRRSAGRGTRITRDHVASLTRPLDSVPLGAVQSLDGLIGRSVKKDLRLGAMVRESDLDVRIDARRGRPMKVRLRSGSLTIEAAGVLKEDGGIGNWVDVVLAGGRELRGLLVGPGVVDIPLGPSGGVQ